MANTIPPKNLLNTQQVLSLKEAELVNILKQMQTSELEHHAEKIMEELGSKDYSQTMAKLMKLLKTEEAQKNQFAFIQAQLEALLPNKAYFSDIYARLAAIVITIIARRFKALL